MITSIDDLDSMLYSGWTDLSSSQILLGFLLYITRVILIVFRES